MTLDPSRQLPDNHSLPSSPHNEDMGAGNGASGSNQDQDEFAAAGNDEFWWSGDSSPEPQPQNRQISNDLPRADEAEIIKTFANGGEDKQADNVENEKSMGLLDHLNELRSRLTKACIATIIGFGICWAFVDQLFDILVNPLLSVLPAGTHAQYTTLPEAFFTRMLVAFVAGFFLASPVIFYQIWAFVSPGLYDEEKRHIIPIAFLSAIFFMGGAAFCYFIVFPFAFKFFISFSTPEILVTPKISDYIGFVLKLLFAFGIIFEMPIFTLFLARMGILTAKFMRKGRKYAIVGIFILAAILTPPDVISQLLMACPMLLLYELSIGIAAIFGRKPHISSTEDEDAQHAR